MSQHHHDPFRARPTVLLGVDTTPPPPPPAPVTYTADDVPEKAADVVAWLRSAAGDDAVARAQAAKAVEDERAEPRSTVTAEVERVLS